MAKRKLVNIEVTDEQREAVHQAAEPMSLSAWTREAWIEKEPKLKEVFQDGR